MIFIAENIHFSKHKLHFKSDHLKRRMVNSRLSLKLYKQNWRDRWYIWISYPLICFYRVTVRANCPMDLRLFPFDKQQCNLNIESCKLFGTSHLWSHYSELARQWLSREFVAIGWVFIFICLYFSDGYNAENMQYRWENRTDKGVAVNEKLDDMPQYNLTGATTTSYFTGYYSGGCIADKSPLGNMFLDLVWQSAFGYGLPFNIKIIYNSCLKQTLLWITIRS